MEDFTEEVVFEFGLQGQVSRTVLLLWVTGPKGAFQQKQQTPRRRACAEEARRMGLMSKSLVFTSTSFQKGFSSLNP